MQAIESAAFYHSSLQAGSEASGMTGTYCFCWLVYVKRTEIERSFSREPLGWSLSLPLESTKICWRHAEDCVRVAKVLWSIVPYISFYFVSLIAQVVRLIVRQTTLCYSRTAFQSFDPKRWRIFSVRFNVVANSQSVIGEERSEYWDALRKEKQLEKGLGCKVASKSWWRFAFSPELASRPLRNCEIWTCCEN